MNILNENILKNQLQPLRGWHIVTRQIGKDISRKGIQDDEIILFLLTLRYPTFLRVIWVSTSESAAISATTLFIWQLIDMKWRPLYAAY